MSHSLTNLITFSHSTLSYSRTPLNHLIMNNDLNNDLNLNNEIYNPVVCSSNTAPPLP